MSAPPAHLKIHESHGRLRGTFYCERDEARMRWFFIGIVAFASACLYAVRGPEDHAPYAYAVAFLALLGALPFAVAVANPPRNLDIDAQTLVFGSDEVPLTAVTGVDLRDVPRAWEVVVKLDGGTALTWPLSRLKHAEEDARWLTDCLRERTGTGGDDPEGPPAG